MPGLQINFATWDRCKFYEGSMRANIMFALIFSSWRVQKDADVHILAEAELGTVSLSSVLGLPFG